MISVLVAVLIAVSVVSTTVVVAYQALGTYVMQAESARNAGQMDATAAVLRAMARAGNPTTERVLMPAPSDPTGSYPKLPSSYAGVTENPWGVPYQYCPYAGPSPATIDVTLETSGDTYDVEYLNVGGTQYVQGADDHPAAPDSVVGFLVSAEVGASAGSMPSCQDISLSGGSWRVAGGIVRAIRAGEVHAGSVASASEVAVVNVAPSAAGDGDGTSPNDPTTLADALSQFRSARPGRMVVEMADGSYTLDGSMSAAESAPRDGARLALLGSGKSNVTISASGGATTPWRPGANLRVEGVSIGPNVETRSAARDVTLVSATVGSLRMRGGELALRGSGGVEFATASSTVPLSLSGTNVTVNGAVTVSVDAGASATPAISVRDGGSFNMDGAASGNPTLSVSGTVANAVGLHVDSGGHAHFGSGVSATFGMSDMFAGIMVEGSTFKAVQASVSVGNGPDNGLYVHNGAAAVLESVALAFPAGATDGVQIADNGSLEMNSGSIGATGTSPDYGIRAELASASLHGQNTSIYSGTDCVDSSSGKVFEDAVSTTGPPGTASDAVLARNTSDWTCENANP